MRIHLLRTLATLALAATISGNAFAAPLSFTQLTLINDWVKYSSTLRTPGVALDANDVVHLRGGMRAASGNSVRPFDLPVGFRPAKFTFVRVDRKSTRLNSSHRL